MVIIDAFFNSHFIEPMDLPDQDLVDLFLPPPTLPERFDIENPAFVSNVVTAGSQFLPFREMAFHDMEKAKEIIREVDREYQERIRQRLRDGGSNAHRDAQLVLVTSGSMTSTARMAIDS